MNDEQNERDNNNKEKKKKEAVRNRLLLMPFVSKTKIRRKPSTPNMSSSSSPPASSGFWKKVCFCGIESSNTLEWSCSSNTDPQDENFTLRVLLQTNDFFSKDCNPHLCLVVACLCIPFLRHGLPLNSAESSAIASIAMIVKQRTPEILALRYASRTGK